MTDPAEEAAVRNAAGIGALLVVVVAWILTASLAVMLIGAAIGIVWGIAALIRGRR